MRSGRRSCADDVDDTSAASGTEALASTTSPSVETERSREVRALEKDHTGVGERKEGPELAHCELEDVCIRLHRATLNMLLIDTALSLSLSLSLPPSLSLTSAQGGVTRQGVVLSYLLSLVIGSQ